MGMNYEENHCNTTLFSNWQERDAELTTDGKQANTLATFLLENQLQIDHIISSPFVRAIDSILPMHSKLICLSKKMND